MNRQRDKDNMQKAQLLKKDSENDFDRIQFGDKTYFLEEVIGQTNASRVYKGHEEINDKELAIKVVMLNSDAGLDELGTYSSIQERVGIYGNINHPHIASLHDFFYIDTGLTEMPVVVRDYIGGESLYEKIEKGHIYTTEEALGLLQELLEIADYLETSTTQEIVVRDVKPSNIIINGDGEAHLTDLELCTSSGQTTTGGRGTYVYMAPEQLFETKATSMWDRYAIAKTLEHVLTSKTPEHGKEVDINDGVKVPRYLRKILRKMTAEKAEERYTNAKDILLELEGSRSMERMADKDEGQALVVRGRTELMPRNLSLIAKYSRKVKIKNYEETEEAEVKRFLAYASSLEPDDEDYEIVCHLSAALRLHYEARQGFTQKEEFLRTVEKLAGLVDYGVSRRDSKEIILVDVAADPTKVIHAYGPKSFYLDKIDNELPADEFIKEHDNYRIGHNPQVTADYLLRKKLLNEDHIPTTAMTTFAGLVGSAGFGGWMHSWMAFGGAFAACLAGSYGVHRLYVRAQNKALEKWRKDNAAAADPRKFYSYNLPSSLIKAFLPGYKGED